MSMALLIVLIAIDLFLLAIVYVLSTRRVDPVAILKEVSDERAYLAELREAVKEELQLGQQRSTEILDKVTKIATEIDMEISTSGQSIAAEMAKILEEMSSKVNEPIEKLNQKQRSIEKLLRKLDLEKKTLQKSLQRAEQLSKFFDKSIPYDELLSEIEDKKYIDARHLLASGMSPKNVARELAISESEVKILAAL